MKFHFIPLLFFLASPAASLSLNVVYPAEGAVIAAEAIDSTFIFGLVQPSDAELIINGTPVEAWSNGAFLAFLPLPGDHECYHCRAVHRGDTLEMTRHVRIRGRGIYERPQIDRNSIYPADSLELFPGELFCPQFRGTSGCRAAFRFEQDETWYPMVEQRHSPFYWGEAVFGRQKSVEGSPFMTLYRGCTKLSAPQHQRLHFRLAGPAGDTLLISPPAVVNAVRRELPRIAELLPEWSSLRSAPDGAYVLFLPRGVRLKITGRNGGYYRVRLSEHELAWVRAQDIRFAAPGTPPSRARIELIRVKEDENRIRIRLFTRTRIPYRIVQDDLHPLLRLTLYDCFSDLDWIRYTGSVSAAGDIRWQQRGDDVLDLRISLNMAHQWGFSAGYDEEDQLCLDIKKPPDVAGWPSSPLKNRTVLLDPGHAPEDGAVGPTGMKEKDANLLLARALGAKLREKGAHVFFSRQDSHGIALGTRVQLARILNPDVFLSLHHNGLPDGVDPFKNRGSSTYYYHAQSRRLARMIHDELIEKLKLPDYGLFYDNLAVCRLTCAPAVLIEPAFIIHPDEEMMIATDKYRESCSDAIVRALSRFFQSARR